MGAAYLYHWTHRDNLASIARGGLDPAFARGSLRAVWMADGTRILWAAAHVAARHQVEPDALVLLRVRVDGLDLTRTSWPNVRVSKQRVAPSRITGVRTVLGTRWESLRRHREVEPCQTDSDTSPSRRRATSGGRGCGGSRR